MEKVICDLLNVQNSPLCKFEEPEDYTVCFSEDMQECLIDTEIAELDAYKIPKDTILYHGTMNRVKGEWILDSSGWFSGLQVASRYAAARSESAMRTARMEGFDTSNIWGHVLKFRLKHPIYLIAFDSCKNINFLKKALMVKARLAETNQSERDRLGAVVRALQEVAYCYDGNTLPVRNSHPEKDKIVADFIGELGFHGYAAKKIGPDRKFVKRILEDIKAERERDPNSKRSIAHFHEEVWIKQPSRYLELLGAEKIMQSTEELDKVPRKWPTSHESFIKTTDKNNKRQKRES
jgi:hypothetical protein